MNYRILVVAMVLGLGGNSYASDDYTDTSEAESDDHVACIEAAIADDIEETSLFDQYVEDCYKDKVAQRKQPAEPKDSNS